MMKGSSFKPKLEYKLDRNEKGLKLVPSNIRSDHDYYDLYFYEKFITKIKISRGSKEWGVPLLGLVAKNLGISKTQLEGIVSCSFGTDDFLESSKILKR